MIPFQKCRWTGAAYTIIIYCTYTEGREDASCWDQRRLYLYNFNRQEKESQGITPDMPSPVHKDILQYRFCVRTRRGERHEISWQRDSNPRCAERQSQRHHQRPSEYHFDRELLFVLFPVSSTFAAHIADHCGYLRQAHILLRSLLSGFEKAKNLAFGLQSRCFEFWIVLICFDIKYIL